MTTYNVNELTGDLLWLATADALGVFCTDFEADAHALVELINNHITAVAQNNIGEHWHADASVDAAEHHLWDEWDGCGDTLAEAVCRAILHAEVGPTVEIEE